MIHLNMQTFSAELRVIVCDKNEKVLSLLGRMKETPNLATLILMDTISADSQKLADECGVKLVQYADLEVGDSGKMNPKCYINEFEDR